jgi:DNA-binding protein HU-beta
MASSIVTTSNLIDTIAAKTGAPKATIKRVIDAFVVETTKAVKKGAKVRVNALGSFSMGKRAARVGRNPATGAKLKIKASKSLRFKASKTAKDAL